MGKKSRTLTERAPQREVDLKFQEMVANLADSENQLELTREALSDVFQAFDRNGWTELSGLNTARGIPLSVVKSWAENNQQLYAINPLVKKAVRIRSSHVFGEGVQFPKSTGAAKKFITANTDFTFSSQAYEEMEATLCTDGNLFLLLDRATNTVYRVPLSEITNVASDPLSSERTWYYKRTWIEQQKDDREGSRPGKSREAWYPIPDINERNSGRKPTRIGKTEVDNSKAMIHIAVNKQVGWVWGIPDVQSVVHWARAYKEFLESNYTLVRALARFTWKYTGSTPTSTKRAAAKMGMTPVDPRTGNATTSAGAAVSIAQGGDLQAINKAGANVNFDTGRPLAAMVAAGMDVSLDSLLADSKGASAAGDVILDPSNVKSYANRQDLIKRGFEKMFAYFGHTKTKIVFPPIQDQAIHRTIQAMTTAASTNLMHVEELREMMVLALRQYGFEVKEGLPEAGAYAKFSQGEDLSNPGTTPQKTPDASNPKKRSPAGALADGDHEMRKTEMLALINDFRTLIEASSQK